MREAAAKRRVNGDHRNYMRAYYHRKRYGDDAAPPPQIGSHLVCQRCEKPFQRQSLKNYSKFCPECRLERRRERARARYVPKPPRQKRTNAERRAQVRAARIKRLYGLSLSEYENLLNSPCAICGAQAEVVDHCHKTGRVRSGLCNKCNRMLGHVNDDPALLHKAADYLLSN